LLLSELFECSQEEKAIRASACCEISSSPNKLA
jgi:hypothetical protein